MNQDQQYHLNSFIDNFVPKSHKARWKTLISSKRIKWEKIKPYDIWPDSNDNVTYCRLLEEEVIDFFKNKKYAKYINNDVAVFPCGHDNKMAEITKLNNVINSEYYLLEGIVSIVPGEFALLVNHDGEICIFEKR